MNLWHRIRHGHWPDPCAFDRICLVCRPFHGDETPSPDGPHSAAEIWSQLEATPGFNEQMRQAETDLAAGLGVPFEPWVAPSPTAVGTMSTDSSGRPTGEAAAEEPSPRGAPSGPAE